MVKLKITKNIFFFKGGAKQFDSEIASKFYNYKQNDKQLWKPVSTIE